MESNIWLTTVDNKYDPFKQFDSWFNFDVINNYNTCSQIARIANTSNSKSDDENKAEIERAIDQIIKYDFANIYRKVYRSEEKVH